MAEKKVLICDNCDATGAERWFISKADARDRIQIDLCPKCATTLVKYRDMGVDTNRPVRKKSRTRFEKVEVQPL